MTSDPSSFAKEITHISLEEEMKQSYLDYAMSVIVGRALPDVRDGLKPVHRRVLYAMKELGNDWNKPYKKSARVVGDVIGKYHPHGDGPVYDTLVRMAQPFSMRYLLVDGQGNFGSVDGDAPAAMRYTEARMTKLSHQLLADIDKQTVNFVANYDESEHEPAVLPTRIPTLLVNGSSGIAVGMATNIPPHRLDEVIDACLAYVDNNDITIDELCDVLPGPDFPTGAIINGVSGIKQAYRTGRGKVQLRAKATIEGTDKQTIIVTEIPYTVNKAKLIERMAELVKEKKITSISALRDESDKDGMRIVIELKRGEVGEVVLNQLYKHTALQTVFGINMVALVDGQPKLLNLKQVIEYFIRHRREVVTRRTIFELRKARDRAHLLEGLTVALSNIDEMIELIKESQTPAIAKEALLGRSWRAGKVVDMLSRVVSDDTRPEGLEAVYGMDGEDTYRLSPAQAQAILELRLHRLTGLEQDKILQEYNELLDLIADLLEILRVPARLIQVVRDELIAVKIEFGDERRTLIDEHYQDMDAEDLIAEEQRIVTLSSDGYVKAQPLSDYRAQRRGGRGKSATGMKEEDEVGLVFVASTHDMLLCFSSLGRLYWKKTWQLPIGSRAAKGKPINNVLPLQDNEHITAILPIQTFDQDHAVFMASGQGVVKKIALDQFSRPRQSGIIAVNLDDGDALIGVVLVEDKDTVMLFSSDGNAVHIQSEAVRAMGRTARGVRGIKLNTDARLMSLQAPQSEQCVLTVTENGFGKLTPVSEYPIKGRGTKGVISIKTSERNGAVVAALTVDQSQEIVMITNQGTLVRTRLAEVSVVGRNTQGVKLINLNQGEQVVSVALADAEAPQADENGVGGEDGVENTEISEAVVTEVKASTDSAPTSNVAKAVEVDEKPSQAGTLPLFDDE